MSSSNSRRQQKKQYYRRIVEAYAKRAQLLFLSRVRARKPFMSINRANLIRHTKDILLYHVLPQVRNGIPTNWPPPKINQIIDQSVNEYIESLKP